MNNRKNATKREDCKGFSFKKKVFLFFLGGIVGFINGFFGGGGGVAGVPILEKGLKLDNKKAHASCLLLILPLSIISSAIYVFSGEIKTALFLSVSAGVLAGGIGGAFLLKWLPANIVRVIFALLLFAGGVRMIICCF